MKKIEKSTLNKIVIAILALIMCVHLYVWFWPSKYMGEYVGSGYIEQEYTHLTIKYDGTFYCEDHGDGTWEEDREYLILRWSDGDTARFSLWNGELREYLGDGWIHRFTKIS